MFLKRRKAPPRPAIDAPQDETGGIPRELLDRVKFIEIKARRLVNDLFLGEYHAVFRGRGIEFDELRPYVPGDDVRSIDWKAMARTGEPLIRRYREECETAAPPSLDRLLAQTAGLWRREDGLDYQQRLRQEWEEGR